MQAVNAEMNFAFNKNNFIGKSVTISKNQVELALNNNQIFLLENGALFRLKFKRVKLLSFK